MPAPLLFTTMIWVPSVSPACCANSRAATSVVEPGASGTTNSIGRLGKFCAKAVGAANIAQQTAMQAERIYAW